MEIVSFEALVIGWRTPVDDDQKNKTKRNNNNTTNTTKAML